jgi:hypothetical protein
MGAARTLSLWMLGALLASSSCARSNGCEEATQQLQTGIDRICREPAFVNSPFCVCCVPNGYYSIDDSCRCKPLVLDAEFCFYSPDTSGDPAIRNAIAYAASVCVNRPASLPQWISTDARVCSAQATAGADADADAGADAGL